MVEQAGSDLLLTLAVVGPLVQEFIDFINGPYRQNVTLYRVPSALEQAVAFVLTNAKIPACHGATAVYSASPACRQAFCSVWANGTYTNVTVVPNTWLGMAAVDSNGGPSGISLASCERMFDPRQALSLLAGTQLSHDTWWNARLGLAEQQTALMSAFALNSDQLSSAISWLTSFEAAFVYGSVLDDFGLGEIDEFGYKQWAMGHVIPGGQSIKDLYPDDPLFQKQHPDVNPEFGLWFFQPTWLTPSRAKVLMNGPFGLSNFSNTANFIPSPFLDPDYNYLEATWNINEEQAMELSIYLLAIGATYSEDRVRRLHNEGGGLFASRSVNDWVFNCYDPFLAYLGMGDCNLYANTSTDAQTMLVPPDTFNTGNSDLSAIGSYEKYHEMAFVPWNGYQLPLDGTEGTQFEPFFLNKFDSTKKFQVFDNDLMRVLDLEYLTDNVVEGITLKRYSIVHSELLTKDARFYQSITGFMNVSKWNQGAPIYLTVPHWCYADPFYTSKVTGVDCPVESQYDTYLDIEPITGVTMNADKRLQVNVYLSPEKGLDFLRYEQFNPTFNESDVFMPLFWVYEHGTISSDLADEFKGSVYLALTIRWVAFGLLLAAGVIMSGISAVLIYLYVRQRRGRKVTIVLPVESSTSGHSSRHNRPRVDVNAPPRVPDAPPGASADVDEENPERSATEPLLPSHERPSLQ